MLNDRGRPIVPCVYDAVYYKEGHTVIDTQADTAEAGKSVAAPNGGSIGEEKTEQTPPAAKASASAGKKLLVVEDNELNLEIASTLLKEAGFAVDTAENGKVAVEKVEARTDRQRHR